MMWWVARCTSFNSNSTDSQPGKRVPECLSFLPTSLNFITFNSCIQDRQHMWFILHKMSNGATAICNVPVLCFAIVFIDGVINRVLASFICSSTDEQFRWNAQGRLNIYTVLISLRCCCMNLERITAICTALALTWRLQHVLTWRTGFSPLAFTRMDFGCQSCLAFSANVLHLAQTHMF